MSLVKSLILSRLWYNGHVWVVDAKMIVKLNAVYSRVLRRICGEMRYNVQSSSLTDKEVRVMPSAASTDCLLQRARLRYLHRLHMCKLSPLLAVLQAAPNGHAMPWSALVLEDLSCLYKSVPSVRQVLPHPTAPYNGNCWLRFLKHRKSERFTLS